MRIELSALLVAIALTLGNSDEPAGGEAPRRYGLISQMTVVDGQRDALIAILLDATADMPGCQSYVVAEDVADSNALWVTEVWDSQQRHRESLALPSVQAALSKGRPLIAGFGQRIETVPVARSAEELPASR